MCGGLIFLKTFRASLFNDDLSNEPNFGRIYLAGQYLWNNIMLQSLQTPCDKNIRDWHDGTENDKNQGTTNAMNWKYTLKKNNGKCLWKISIKMSEKIH